MNKRGTKTSYFGTISRISHDSSIYYGSRLYADLLANNGVNAHPDQDFPPALENKLVLGSSANMQEIPDRSLHLMVTSPPYNVTKEYDEDLSLKEYLQLLRDVFSETYRELVDGGRARVNVANLGRRPYIPLPDLISQIMIEIGFLMRGEIIWQKGAGAGVSMAWGSWQSASNPKNRWQGKYHQPRAVHGVDQIGMDDHPRIGEESGASGAVSNRVALSPDPVLYLQRRRRLRPLHGQWHNRHRGPEIGNIDTDYFVSARLFIAASSPGRSSP